MGEFDLNLSTRPFPAYRVTDLALLTFLVVLIIVSVWQAYGYIEYSAMSRDIRDEEQELRVESEVLSRRLEEAESRLDRPEATAKLEEVQYLNDLIARKSFSWTRIFAQLEDMIPNDVHLVSMSPQFAADGTVLLQLSVRGRNHEEISALIETLEQSDAFANVIVSNEQKAEQQAAADINVGLSVNYYPDKDAQ